MLKLHKVFVAMLGLATLSGCATYMEGTSQALPIHTDPVHAICDVYKDNKLIGATSDQTPVVYITKSVRALRVTCSAPGYDTKSVKVISATSPWGGAGFWLWDLAVTDWISGALNKYPDGVSVALNPTPGPNAERMRQSMNDELRTRPRVASGANLARAEVRPGIQVPYSLAGAKADEPFAVAQDGNREPASGAEK